MNMTLTMNAAVVRGAVETEPSAPPTLPPVPAPEKPAPFVAPEPSEVPRRCTPLTDPEPIRTAPQRAPAPTHYPDYDVPRRGC